MVSLIFEEQPIIGCQLCKSRGIRDVRLYILEEGRQGSNVAQSRGLDPLLSLLTL